MNTAATNVVFISPALIRAARGAAALDQRIGHFTHLTIKVNHHGDAWSLNGDAILLRAGGGAIISPFLPVDESSPFAEQSRRRFAAAEELRALVAELPFTGAGLTIPLHAVA
ncbi:hypothetical protein [Streptomyces europaeiscabiei]|uniref:hypothetical protein n=1 Tax=Streptomyces europaeiscabiei TaxID=146819 RepID=UPI0029B3E8D0|nr:hypothetical protein [Streptomyces europaeiscabiei]MDX3672750.1 hypothetical protein [Streptomyces europaeiscabiei]